MTDMALLDLVALIAGVSATAILAGIMAGLLGVGGGIVLVPVLFWILTLMDFPPDLTMQMAVATSLATIIFTSISSARAHHKRGSVDLSLLKLWAPGLMLGALTGGLAAKYIEASGLKLVFGTIALLVALNMATPRTLVLSSQLPQNRLVNVVISYIIGGFSSLMGIGGGTLSVPTLSAFSFDIKRAIGTASAFGILIAIPAVMGFILSGLGVPSRPPFSLGFVSIPAALLILPFTVSFAPVGTALAHKLDRKWIKLTFAVFLAATSIKMLSSALG